MPITAALPTATWTLLATLALPLPALAQEAVPLTDALFDTQWVAIAYKGQNDTDAYLTPATLQFDGTMLSGDSPCAEGWSATLDKTLPKFAISDVQSYYDTSCPAVKNTIAFLDSLEAVRSARTSPDGLELLSESGERLLLLVSGG